MEIFKKNDMKKLYHSHSPHVDSFNFKKIPRQIKRTIPAKELPYLESIPLIRLDEPRTILLNEADEAFEEFVRIFVMLDSMRDTLLHDIYAMYVRNRENVSLDNFVSEDTEETYKNILLLLIPEVLWCRGDNSIGSKIFK